MILNNIKSSLQSSAFISDCRLSTGDFSRQRILTFERIGLFFLQGAADSLKYGMESLLKGLTQNIKLKEHGFVSQQAISKACRKFPYQAFIALQQQSVKSFYSEYDSPRWMGFRLVGVDGSKVRLPNKTAMADEFGVQTNGGTTERPMALLVAHYDALTKTPLSAELSPCYMGERFLAERLLPQRSENDLLLYDRGFPSFVMFALHQSLQVPFCMRMVKNYNAEVKQFIADGVVDRIVEMQPNRKNRKDCLDMGISTDPVTVRLIRVRLKSGEIEVLATSLLNKDPYPAYLFKDLYAKRWAIEEGFKALKAWAAVETYRIQDGIAIYQEVYARLLMVTLASISSTLCQSALDQRTGHRQYTYKVNLRSLLRKLRFSLVELWNAETESEAFSDYLRWAASDCTPVRPGRSYERKSNNISALPDRRV